MGSHVQSPQRFVMRTPALVFALSLTLAAPATAQQPGPYTFLMVSRGDTVASEVVRRTPTRVAADMIYLPAGRRWRFTIVLGSDGRAASIQDSVYALATPGAGPIQVVDVTFEGDSAAVRTEGRINRTLTLPTRPGAVPFIAPSSISLEQVLRQAKATGRRTDTIPVFNLGNGRTGPAIVRWTAADSAEVVYGDIVVHARVSKDGSLLGYALPNQGSDVVRVEGAHPLAGALTSGATQAVQPADAAAAARAASRAPSRPSARSQTAAAQASDSVRAALVSAVERAVKAAGPPGAQVLVMRDGQVLLDRGFGVRNVDDQAPVDVDTRFEIGSITKQFTAAAILQLVEQKKLSLDDTLGQFVPGYAAGAGITLRQLLWQVSGIPNYTAVPDFAKYATTHDGGLDGVLALIRDKPLEFRPGTKWEYSNSNYFLLGRVVEVASGLSWEQYIRTHIFEPAGMTQSTFTDHEFGLLDMATGYEKRNGEPFAVSTPGKWPGAAGAIVSTVGDLSKWDDAFFAGRIVSPAHVKLATTPGTLADGSATGYGFGWFADTQAGQRRVFHTGGTSGFASINETFPDLGERIIVLVNQLAGGAAPIASAAFDALNPKIAAAQDTPAPGEDPAITKLAREWWRNLLSGRFDRSRLAPGMDSLLTPETLKRSAAQLQALGPPQRWIYRGKREQNGITGYAYRVTFAGGRVLNVTMALTADGKLAGYAIRPG